MLGCTCHARRYRRAQRHRYASRAIRASRANAVEVELCQRLSATRYVLTQGRAKATLSGVESFSVVELEGLRNCLLVGGNRVFHRRLPIMRHHLSLALGELFLKGCEMSRMPVCRSLGEQRLSNESCSCVSCQT